MMPSGREPNQQRHGDEVPVRRSGNQKSIAVLGATGSVGQQALNVLAALPEQFRVEALSGHRNIEALATLALAHRPNVVVVKDVVAQQAFEAAVSQVDAGYRPTVYLSDDDGLCQMASLDSVDVVLNGLVGFAGLLPTMAALKAGKLLLTGNKETIVTAGHLLQPYLSQILPLDSEHSAIFQCLLATRHAEAEVRQVSLTASGGPFFDWPAEKLLDITPAQALKHPRWSMGARISIDSATMMNKGFERIEAHMLFNLPYEKIEIVIHPQSLVHSAVSYVDGSMVAQLGATDMRLPILYALSYPARWPIHDERCHLSLSEMGALDFRAPDELRFPCLRLAREAADVGGSLLTVLNAADEVAVEAFLEGRITWTELPTVIEAALAWHQPDIMASPSLETIIEVDAATRATLQERFQLSPQRSSQSPVLSA